MYIVWLLWILFRILKHYNIHGMTIHCRFLYYYKLLIDLDLLVCGGQIFQLNFRTSQLPPTSGEEILYKTLDKKCIQSASPPHEENTQKLILLRLQHMLSP